MHAFMVIASELKIKVLCYTEKHIIAFRIFELRKIRTLSKRKQHIGHFYLTDFLR